jgi:peptidoglycan/xylan/chitin deacetylase (PgdA/CDA1 family)
MKRRFEYKATCKVITDQTKATDETMKVVEAELNELGAQGWELVQRSTATLDVNRLAVWDIWKRELE